MIMQKGSRLLMTKRFIADVIQRSTGISSAAGAKVARDLLDAIVETLHRNGKFTLPGFGTFTVRMTKARNSVNPRTAEAIKVKAGKTVRFKVSPNLRANV